MRTDRLLLVLASLLFPLSAQSESPSHAERDAPGARGVPFDRTQQQINQLRERIQALEAASPAGQSCLPGQFVTGFNSAGAILCASATGGSGTPTPPPAPGPVPLAVFAALEQAIFALEGQNVPLQVTPSTNVFNGATFTIQPRSYSLTTASLSFSQPNAVTLAVQVPIPAFSLGADVSVTSPLILGTASGFLVFRTTNAVLNLTLSIVDTPTGMRRLGAVTVVHLSLGANTVTGTLGSPLLDSFVQQSLVFADQGFANVLEPTFANAVNQALPTLPEF